MAAKGGPIDYFHRDRSEFLNWVGGRYERVLEVGCAAGANADWFRSHGARELVGVEIAADAASVAAGHFDQVYAEAIETALTKLHRPFDLIVCADVLEHLVDPWSICQQLLPLASEGGVFAVSLPNIRYYRALARIAIGKGFRYEPEGTFDVTHLRFFTRANAAAMLTDGGWNPIRWGGSRPRWSRVATALSYLTRGRTDEWLVHQWYVVAKRQ